MCVCWSNHRAAIAEAEEALKAHGSVAALGEARGATKHLRELIWSRTGHGPKAKNNANGELTAEAEKACKDQPSSLCPRDENENEDEFEDEFEEEGEEEGGEEGEEEGGGEEEGEPAGRPRRARR